MGAVGSMREQSVRYTSSTDPSFSITRWVPDGAQMFVQQIFTSG